MFNNLNQFESPDYSIPFIGKVVDNNDPKKLQRVKVEIPNLLTGDPANLPWCFPAQHSLFGMTESAYSVNVPVVGSTVMVEFQGGDIHYGVVSSCLHTSKTTVSGELANNYPNRRGWLDPANNLFYIDITSGQVIVHFLHKSGTRLTVADNGKVTVHSVDDIAYSCNNFSLNASKSILIQTPTYRAETSTTSIVGTTDIQGNTSTTGTLTNNGTDVSSTHAHSGISRGPGVTDPPV
jgi:phage baseplate assembly protein gpV